MSVNKAILLGNLGKDPEIRYTADNKPVASVTLATSTSWIDKKTGEKVEKTTWHRIVFFNRMAEIAEKYLKKGSKVYIEGEINNREYEDDAGIKRYVSEIVVNTLDMISTGNSGANEPASDQINGHNTNEEDYQNAFDKA